MACPKARSAGNVRSAMPTNVLMPQLGESIVEGTIVRWNKKVGDTVDRDEPIFEISTDKVDAEIPSPAAGVLSEVRVGEGETVPVDTVVAVIGGVVSPAADREPTRPPETPAIAILSSAATAAPVPPPVTSTWQAAPVVRRLASEHDIDLATVKGTGVDGRVTKADVIKLVGGVQDRHERVEPLSVMRRQIAARMVASRRTSAHVHTVFDVDFSRVAALRLKAVGAYEQQGVKLTHLTFIAKAAIDALGKVPIINATLRGEDVVYRQGVNLGIAVALDQGLIVPVVQVANAKPMVELSRSIADLSERARSKRLTPADVEDGTFTITNPGVFGSILGMPIINPPQLAILCVGAVEQRPVVVEGVVTARLRSYLTLGFDHRVIDGAVADRYMSLVQRNLEDFDASLL